MSGKSSMLTKFAYLKPCENDSPFYVHLTLNEATQTMRVYYHMSWWKREEVDKDVFNRWMTDFRNLVPCLHQTSQRSAKKTPIKSRANSVRVRGRCKVYAHMFKDIIGFVEKDTAHEIPIKIECYTNIESKMIEIELTLPYQYLGHLHQELHKLPIFTVNPDYETIRHRLLFFNMKYIVGFQTKTPLQNSLILPKHDGSPSLSSIGQTSTLHGNTGAQHATQTTETRPRELDDFTLDRLNEFKLDPAYCTGEHPYGYAMLPDINTSTPAEGNTDNRTEVCDVSGDPTHHIEETNSIPNQSRQDDVPTTHDAMSVTKSDGTNGSTGPHE